MTAVRTLYKVQIWKQHGRKGFPCATSQKAGDVERGGRRPTTDDLTTDDRAAGFIPQRGTGQGDVVRPACWAAAFDIQLTAQDLDAEVTGTLWVGAGANTGYKGRVTAYADDLLSTTRDKVR